VIKMQTKETEMVLPSVFRTLARPLARIDHFSDERIVMPAISAPFKCVFSLASNRLNAQIYAHLYALRMVVPGALLPEYPRVYPYLLPSL